jgi:hypothetical protein
MKGKKLLLGSLFAGGALAATHLLFTKKDDPGTSGEKPASKISAYDAIDAYIQQQMRRLHIPRHPPK